MRRFQELRDEAEVVEAMRQAREWGYPRDLIPEERTLATWFRYGPDVLFWFTWDGEHPKRLRIHLVAEPLSRGLWYSRRWMTGVEVIAELLSATAIEASDCSQDGVMVKYAARVGWEQVTDDDGEPIGGLWSRAVGGV